MQALTKVLIGAAALVGSGAQAQSTQCQWIGNVWTCNQAASQPEINWDLLQPQQTPGDAFQRGMENSQRAWQARLEQDRIRAETELYRAQAQAAQQSARPEATVPSPQVDYFQAWYAAAEPRMGLYADFREVVFAPDVRISPAMVMLMSGSTYAADIAYHLATHKAEAMAISTLPLLDAARAIDEIEAQVRTGQPTE